MTASESTPSWASAFDRSAIIAHHRQLRMTHAVNRNTWTYDPDRGQLEFLDGRHCTAVALGTFARAERTWLWADVNPSCADWPTLGYSHRIARHLRSLGPGGEVGFQDPGGEGHHVAMIALAHCSAGGAALVPLRGDVPQLYGYAGCPSEGGVLFVGMLEDLGSDDRIDDAGICAGIMDALACLPVVDQRLAITAYARWLGLACSEDADRLVLRGAQRDMLCHFTDRRLRHIERRRRGAA